MKDSGSIHQKVQELCDCFALNDPLQEMSRLKDDPDHQEAALKWLALSVLHGINSNAEQISIERSKDNQVTVRAKYRTTDLPSPNGAGDALFEAIRNITHIEGEKGKTRLAMGFRGNSLDLGVKMKKKDGRERITFKF